MPTSIRVRRLHTFHDREIVELAELLIDCVEGGASVSFMLPLSREKAGAYWRGVATGAVRGERVVLAALDVAGTIVGTVQVMLNLPENQPHRGDLAKMLVHRRARRQGVGTALLAAAEECARDEGRSLLVLDTASADAERLYERQGWQRVGVVPGYALYPDGRPCATTFYFKALSAGLSVPAAP
ncbi:MAG TPA: GNAT family N-acetyltransferase [Steroidobacteraceae bacterium]|nr:GNAT family N-acetyltransferase [Steroidobacteraceae bacterium]